MIMMMNHSDLSSASLVSDVRVQHHGLSQAEDLSIVSPLARPLAVISAIVRPLPLKVVCPLPQRDPQDCYHRAYELGASAAELHRSVLKRKQKEETGREYHGTQAEDIVIPEHYAYDRLSGAKNPSPEDASDANSHSGNLAVALALRKRSPSPLGSTVDGILELEHTAKQRSVRVCPVPLRVSRPSAVVDMEEQRAAENTSASALTPLSVVSSFPYEATLFQKRTWQENPLSSRPSSESKALERRHFELPQGRVPLSRVSSISTEVNSAREGLLRALAVSGGDTESEMFVSCLNFLRQHCTYSAVDTPNMSEGMWLMLTKPSFYGQLGENDAGDPLYTLGRMAFDMLSPTNLVCSLQGNFNSIERVVASQVDLESVPVSLRGEVGVGSLLRTYNFVSAFTIEPNIAAYPDAPNKDVHRPIRGIMTTYGYTLPDPHAPNRQSIWITGGRIEPNDNGADLVAWKRQFKLHPPKHSFSERAKLLAVKMLMGATVDKEMADDGSLEFKFTSPLGGHKRAYVETVFADESLRVVRGHRGTIIVSTRLN